MYYMFNMYLYFELDYIFPCGSMTGKEKYKRAVTLDFT